MASEEVQSSVRAPTKLWFARLGLSGRLLAIGGLAGIVISFLPLASVSVEMGDPFGMFIPKALHPDMSKSVRVVEDWRGIICLFAYLAALVIAFPLYPPGGLGQGPKALPWVGVSLGLLTAVMAIWLLVLATEGVSTVAMNVTATPGIGAYLNVLAAGAVAVGGILKAREELLI